MNITSHFRVMLSCLLAPLTIVAIAAAVFAGLGLLAAEYMWLSIPVAAAPQYIVEVSALASIFHFMAILTIGYMFFLAFKLMKEGTIK